MTIFTCVNGNLHVCSWSTLHVNFWAIIFRRAGCLLISSAVGCLWRHDFMFFCVWHDTCKIQADNPIRYDNKLFTRYVQHLELQQGGSKQIALWQCFAASSAAGHYPSSSQMTRSKRSYLTSGFLSVRSVFASRICVSTNQSGYRLHRLWSFLDKCVC